MSSIIAYPAEGQNTGTTLTASGTANSKGSWTQIDATTDANHEFLIVALGNGGADARAFLVDIATGASSSEVVRIPNINRTLYASSHWPTWRFPLATSSGTRLAGRCQSDVGSATIQVRCWGGSSDIWSGVNASTLVTYGAVTGSSRGTLITDPGATDTWGAWTQLTASTSAEHNQLVAVMGNDWTVDSCQAASSIFQIGVGAAASETAIHTFTVKTNSNSDAFDTTSYPVNVNVASGSRLSMRTTRSAAVGTTFNVVVVAA